METKVNDKPIDETITVGNKKYNVRLDSKDNGILTVSHAVNTGSEKNGDLKFLGNIRSQIFDANEKGIKRLVDILQNTGNERRYEIIHTVNRQILSDGKNDHRTACTRKAAPQTVIKNQMKAVSVKDKGRQNVLKAVEGFLAIGIDPELIKAMMPNVDIDSIIQQIQAAKEKAA